MRTESADYSLIPPELTDSEDEYDSETDTEDSVPAERHPSGSTSSAITRSIIITKYIKMFEIARENSTMTGPPNLRFLEGYLLT